MLNLRLDWEVLKKHAILHKHSGKIPVTNELPNDKMKELSRVFLLGLVLYTSVCLIKNGRNTHSALLPSLMLGLHGRN